MHRMAPAHPAEPRWPLRRATGAPSLQGRRPLRGAPRGPVYLHADDAVAADPVAAVRQRRNPCGAEGRPAALAAAVLRGVGLEPLLGHAVEQKQCLEEDRRGEASSADGRHHRAARRHGRQPGLRRDQYCGPFRRARLFDGSLGGRREPCAVAREQAGRGRGLALHAVVQRRRPGALADQPARQRNDTRNDGRGGHSGFRGFQWRRKRTVGGRRHRRRPGVVHDPALAAAPGAAASMVRAPAGAAGAKAGAGLARPHLG
mmetsp:Transcript_75998/g.219472  ORF Transcript_75998/g.219472 Transcript_75998/m.219472 type:complete len:259 (+) Transcript_75998:640-1416(+)